MAAFDEMFAVGEASDEGYASEVNHWSGYFVVTGVLSRRGL